MNEKYCQRLDNFVVAYLVADTSPLALGLVVGVGDADKAAGSATALDIKESVCLTGIVFSH